MAQNSPVERKLAVVVEDDDAQRDLITALLEELDLNVVSCETAEAARDLLGCYGGNVAVLLTDVRLPGLQDGIALAQDVLRLWPTMKVVITSGFPPPQPVPEGALFLPKPWHGLDLLVHAYVQ